MASLTTVLTRLATDATRAAELLYLAANVAYLATLSLFGHEYGSLSCKEHQTCDQPSS